MSATFRARHCFVVPDLDGPFTGGTLYNRSLCEALAREGHPVEHCSLEAPKISEQLKHANRSWVDTLYLDAFPALEPLAPNRVGLLTHYLPSFVRAGRAVQADELDISERRALALADAFLVTSGFMERAIRNLVGTRKPILVVPPGCSAYFRARPPPQELKPRAILIANLTAGKGVLPFLRALATRVVPSDAFELSIVGSLESDSVYAAECESVVSDNGELRSRVVFRGALDRARTLSLLGESTLLVSASRMESYGMALSEARCLGVPIVACEGGNAAEHVRPEAGGRLVADPPELASAFVELFRSPEILRNSLERAQCSVPRARAWIEAARDFVTQTRSLE